MHVETSKSLSAARTELQAACADAYLSITRHARKHRRMFIWQMDKSLERSLSRVLHEGASNTVFSAEQVRRIARENGKAYAHACMAITPKLLSLGSCLKAIATGDRTLQEEINCFRSLAERIAILDVTLDRLRSNPATSRLHTFEDLLEVREMLMSLIGTRFNWAEFQFSDFSGMPSKTDYVHDPEQTWVDLSAGNILGHIDKAQKKERYKGIRPFYSFCCEFVHPNVGDIFSVTASKALIRTDGANLHTRPSSMKARSM